MSEVIARLHRALVDALEQTRNEPFAQPVTVAEIYQDLVPYARARTAIGVDLNADYEHALLRFLAGEHGRARLEPMNARDEIMRELESPNPNVTIYRKFAACDVWVADLPSDERDPWEFRAEQPAAVAEPEAWAAAEAELPGWLTEPEPTAEAPRKVEPEPEEEVAVAAVVEDAGEPTRDVAHECYACAEVLPVGREVRFCPQCGMDQRHRPCAECGERLERDWRFCVECGAAANGA